MDIIRFEPANGSTGEPANALEREHFEPNRNTALDP
jgi:hypothetical protein